MFCQPKILDIFLISPWKHMLWFSIEAPQRGTSNEYPQHMFLWRSKKNIMWIPAFIPSYANAGWKSCRLSILMSYSANTVKVIYFCFFSLSLLLLHYFSVNPRFYCYLSFSYKFIISLCFFFSFFLGVWSFSPLRKDAYSNIQKISPPKTENFQVKTLIFFRYLLKT